MIRRVDTADEIALAAFDTDPAPAGAPAADALRPLRQAAQGGRRVLLLGFSGSGRSTLLRHWLGEHLARDRAPARGFVFPGTGARHRRTPACFLHTLCAWIGTTLGEPDPIPTDFEGLREALPGWLARAGSRGRVLLVLDDLDHLIDGEPAGGFGWLPRYLPPTVTLVASAAPGFTDAALRDAGWDRIFLAGPHDGDRLGQRLAADTGTTEDPVAAVPGDDTGARRALSLLWAAPEGIDRARLGVSGSTLAPLSALLRVDGERVTLRHEQLRNQVAARWLGDRSARREAHRALADTAADTLERAWRLAGAEAWPDLLELLSTPELLNRLDEEPFALRVLWDALPARDTAVSHLAQALTDLLARTDIGSDSIVRCYRAGTRILPQLDAADAVPPLLRAARRHLEARDASLAVASIDHLLGTRLAEAENDAAEEPLRAALSVREARHGPDHAHTRSSRHALAVWHEQRGELKAAETLYRTALTAREAVVGRDHPALLPHLGNLAGVLRAEHRFEEARPLLERALRLAESGPGRDHPGYAAALDNLAGLLYSGHDYQRAADRYREALATTERLFGPDHPATAACAHNLGTTLDALERYPEAQRLYERALEIRRAVYGEEHAETATSLHNLAGVLDVLGRREEAEALYRKAVAVWTAVVGAHHPATATSLNNLADLLRETGRHGEAEPLYQANLDTWRELLGEDHPNTLMTAAELGGLYADTGRHADAERLLRHTVDALERVMGADNLLHVDAVCRLARVLRETGRADDAVRLLEARYQRARATATVISPRMQKLRRHLDAARDAGGGGAGAS